MEFFLNWVGEHPVLTVILGMVIAGIASEIFPLFTIKINVTPKEEK